MLHSCLIAALSLCVLSEVLVTEANIHLHVRHDTRRAIYLGTFAFGPEGVARLWTRKFSAPLEMMEVVRNKTVLNINAPLGFILQPTDNPALSRLLARYARGEISLSRWGGESHKTGAYGHRNTSGRECFIRDPFLGLEHQAEATLFPFEGLSVDDICAAPMARQIKYVGLYAVYFYNCFDLSPNDTMVSPKTLPSWPVSFDVIVELYWMEGKRKRNYLSYSDCRLPTTYFFFGVIFVAMGILWALKILREWVAVKKIHLLMLMLLVIKAATLFIESMKLHQFSKTGMSSTWDCLFYLAITLKGVMLFALILLLGAGWSTLRDQLCAADKRILIVVLPCQIMLNICFVVIEEMSEGSRSWHMWFDILQILDVVCCCCVLFPIISSIKKFRETSNADESTERSVKRIKEFRTFYVVIVAYIYITRVVLVMVVNAVSYEKEWMAKSGSQVIAVLFYAYCGYRFRPRNNANVYNVLQRVEMDVGTDDTEMSIFRGTGKRTKESAR